MRAEGSGHWRHRTLRRGPGRSLECRAPARQALGRGLVVAIAAQGGQEVWTGPSDHGGPAAPHGGLGHEAGIGRAGPRLPTALALSSAPWPQGAPGPLTRHGERLSTQEPPEGSGEEQPSQRTVLGALGRAEATAGQDSSGRLGHRGPPCGATPFLLPLLPPLGVGGQTPHVANWRHDCEATRKGSQVQATPGLREAASVAGPALRGRGCGVLSCTPLRWACHPHHGAPGLQQGSRPLHSKEGAGPGLRRRAQTGVHSARVSQTPGGTP